MRPRRIWLGLQKRRKRGRRLPSAKGQKRRARRRRRRKQTLKVAGSGNLTLLCSRFRRPRCCFASPCQAAVQKFCALRCSLLHVSILASTPFTSILHYFIFFFFFYVRPPSMHARNARSQLPLLLLAVTLPLALLSWPVLLLCVFIPFFGFLSLPSVLSCSLYILYGSTWLTYLLLAPSSPLPSSPFRCYKVSRALLIRVKEAWRLNLGGIAMDWTYRRVMVLGSKGREYVVKENISYGSCRGNKRLDLYFPVRRSTTASSDDSDEPRPQVPIVVFIPGGGWAFTDKRYYLQLALTLRKKGLMVITPDIVSELFKLHIIVELM